MTTLNSPTSNVTTASPRLRRRGLTRQYLDLTKARLSALVVLSTTVGGIVATSGAIDWMLLMWTSLGTALAAASASAFNQIIEAKRDALMHRTEGRPLPSGAMSQAHGFVAAMVMGYLGVSVLVLFVNVFAAALALGTLLLYVGLYTPLKIRSTLNTLVGAVCGAIPPMIGWVAVTGSLDLGAWVLGAILFVWQLPHFLALAWLYRDDYRRGGFAMLPVIDPTGGLTSRIVLLTSLMLIPLGLLVTRFEIAGWWFAIGSFGLGCWFVSRGIKLLRDRSALSARRVFLGSILYLMLLLGLMVVDRGPATGPSSAPIMAQGAPEIVTASLLPGFAGE